MKKLRVLCLTHEDLVPPGEISGEEVKNAPWRTEHYVSKTLEKLGHDVKILGVRSDLGVVKETVEDFKPHIAFNLLEEFDGRVLFDQNVVSFLELLKVPYTGCNPRGMMLARDKALARKIMSYHRIPGPDFAVFPLGRVIRRPRRLQLPLFVKSLVEEASLGISQASIVHTDEELEDRVRFIHERVGTDAIAEEYIDGRELYVSIVGNERLTVFPIWELVFEKMPEDLPKIATRKVKWDPKYQEKHGITSRQAKDLTDEVRRNIVRIAKRVYKVLGLSGYARIDMRLTEDGKVFVIEANPNPEVALGEDFADSAKCTKMTYEELIQCLLTTGLRRAARATAD